ncbi:MAG: class I SAM-dependent RNA methyltransferase [Magnetospirillum sp.]|nr:class I SAM-dependent RNA methyltransferase [Magnetospirillum sp.]
MKDRPRSHAQRGKAKRAAPASRIVELEIAAVGARGDGVANLSGEAVFVPFTVAGDRVLARIEGRRGEGLAAALIEVLAPGPDRVPALCPHYARCGGCSLQHLADQAYAAWKRELLVTQLARHGLGAAPVEPLVRVAPGSRRRAAFAFMRRRNDTLLGFHARASHAVIDVETCPLMAPEPIGLLPPLRRMLSAVVPEGGGDVVATLTEGGLDVLVEAEARLDLFDRERLAAFADENDLARLSWRRPGSGVIDPVARRHAPVVRFAGVAVEPPPGAFLQPTGAGERAIAERVADAVGDARTVADLYSGCGSFTMPLAAPGRIVHAVEGEDASVRALEAAARQAGLGVTAEVRDLARRPLLSHELGRFQAVVLDPPRAGAVAQAEQLASAGPPAVVAVSCNPATLARDLRILVDGGYRLDSVTPIDQFPWSAHLEAVAVLRR